MRARRALALTAVVLGAGAAMVRNPRPPARVDVLALAETIGAERDHVSAPTLARWIRDGRHGLIVLDLRPPADYEALHIPGAESVTLRELATRRLPKDAPIVLYSEGGAHAGQGWVLLRARGYRRVWFLREGVYEWVSRVLEPRLAVNATPAEEAAFAAIASVSRYFGGVPRRGVPRAEVPTGYWSEAGSAGEADVDSPKTVDATAGRAGVHRESHRIRRRGC